MNDEYRYHDMLREWAGGSRATESAVELLIEGFRGRFAAEGNPWIHTAGAIAAPYIVWDDINDDTIGALSSGEQRYLRLAASLGGGHLVDLRDALHLDQEHLALVVAAIGHVAAADPNLPDTAAIFQDARNQQVPEVGR